MVAPIVDKRDSKQIYNQIIELAKYYVPEWNTSGSEDVGIILSQVFSNMFAQTIQRFNKMPYKNFIYFLNLLGADTLASISSRGYITVDLNEGSASGVMIKKGTHAYSQTEDKQRVLFEVKNDMYAIDNKIMQIYCKSDSKNSIVKLYDALESNENKSFKLFDFYGNHNLQKRRIIFSENEVLHIDNKAEVSVMLLHNQKPYLENKIAEKLGNSRYAVWEYLSKDGWHKIDKVAVVGNKISMTIHTPIDEVIYHNSSSRWLSCSIIDNSGFEEIEIAFTDLKLCSKGEHILPESLYNNDLALLNTDFLPFNQTYSCYDAFYINSTEVFTKKGAVIHMNLTIDYKTAVIELAEDKFNIKWKPILSQKDITPPKQVNIDIEKVIWEYWNGIGWARLFEDNSYENIFKLSDKKNIDISFICPKDIDTAYIGAHYGMWIRARILNINNVFELGGCYNYPVVETLSLSYCQQFGTVERILVEHDCETKLIEKIDNSEIEIYSKEKNDFPAAYMALQNPIKQGPVKLYFQKEGKDIDAPPALKWEYYGHINGTKKWIEIKVLDESKCLKHSGLLTFSCNEDFEKLKLFGVESYWIRAVNTDRGYDRQDIILPSIKGIYFNTVKITQQETMQTEYFSIEHHETNKVCQLISGNLVSQKVWVNEVSDLLADDVNHYDRLQSEDIIIEKDSQAIIQEYWVKWKEVENIKHAQAEDRVYCVDKKNGRIIFGDGKNGKVPNGLDTESIRVDYCITQGDNGNILENQIEGFSDPVPFVKRVYNTEAVSGGCDVETITEAIDRGSKTIRHQDKAVAYDDYENIVKQSDRNIVKVKSISHMNVNGEPSHGSVTIIILPKVINSSGKYFSNIRENALAQLRQKGPAVLTYSNNLDIIEAQYIEFCVAVNVKIDSYDSYQDVYNQIQNKLTQFLNPIDGNFDRKGFDIGVLPTKIKLYNYIKTIENIKSIQNISISCYKIVREDKKEIDYYKIFDLPYVVPISGIHTIEVELL